MNLVPDTGRGFCFFTELEYRRGRPSNGSSIRKEVVTVLGLGSEESDLSDLCDLGRKLKYRMRTPSIPYPPARGTDHRLARTEKFNHE